MLRARPLPACTLPKQVKTDIMLRRVRAAAVDKYFATRFAVDHGRGVLETDWTDVFRLVAKFGAAASETSWVYLVLQSLRLEKPPLAHIAPPFSAARAPTPRRL